MTNKRKTKSDPGYIPSEPNAVWGGPIPVPPNVATFEAEYKLPALIGTVRQIAWARNIRQQYLKECFQKLMGETQGHDNPTTVYNALDGLRELKTAKAWIEDHRPHLGAAMDHLLTMRIP